MQATSGTKRILIVDDEEPVREIVATVLGTGGYECVMVPSGIDALTLLEAGEKFDLITSDIATSPMWGSDFLIEISADFRRSRRW